MIEVRSKNDLKMRCQGDALVICLQFLRRKTCYIRHIIRRLWARYACRRWAPTLSVLWLEGQKYFAGTVAEEITEKPDLPLFVAIVQWLDLLFAGRKPAISGLPLRPEAESSARLYGILRGFLTARS